MSLIKMAVLAAALALPVTTLSIVPADAAMHKKHHKAKVHHHKSCGAYMYWKGGKCNDARLKKK